VSTALRPFGVLAAGLQVLVGLAARFARLVARLVPRRRDLWVFGSWYGTRFSGSPRALFVYCLRFRATEISVAWISRRRELVRELRALGLPAYHRFSIRGLWLCLRAGVYVFDCRSSDINYVTSGGAVTINLWHGTPLKRIEHDIEDPTHPYQRAHVGSWWRRVFYRVVRPTDAERYDFVCAASPFVAERLAQAFRMPIARILVGEAPCNDALLVGAAAYTPLRQLDHSLLSRLEAHREAGTRVVAYLPTFRDAGNASSDKVSIEWGRLEPVLRRSGAVFCWKAHGEDRRQLPHDMGGGLLEALPTEVDAHLLLHKVDVLITDYSSIYFDYLLTDRPIIFYAYDLSHYVGASRTLYEPYGEVTPGLLARDSDELASALASVLEDYTAACQRHAEQRRMLRARLHAAPNPGATFTETIYDRVSSVLKRQ